MGLIGKKDCSAFYIPKRYVITILGFFATFNMYTMMVNLTVAMVAMVNATDDSAANQSAVTVTDCIMLIEPETNSSRMEFLGERYEWDSTHQGMILGAIFYGYVLTQVPGGLLSERFGAKWVLGLSLLAASVLTLFTPLAARGGVAAMMTVRILLGLVEGVTIPALSHVVSRWSPVMERSRMNSIILSGLHVGSVVSLTSSGWLSSIALFGGWPAAFYAFGIAGCIWFILWATLMYESPSIHPTISKAELLCIMDSRENSSESTPALPWKAILTSIPMWAAILAHIGDTLGLIVFLTELPSYLSSILHYNLEEDGILSAIPIIMQAVATCVASIIADKLRVSGIISITCIRKIFNTIGLVGPAICLLIVTVCGCRPHLIMGLLTMAMALNGCVFSGIYVIYVDMCPEFAGTIFGLANSFCNIFAVAAPALVGVFTSSGSTIKNWNKVFYMASGTYVGCALVFLLFASAEEQPWVKVAQEKKAAKESTSL